MKTAIITDSNSGITPQMAKELGIFLIAMPVIIDEKTRFEGIDLTQKEFYDSLTGGREVSTSQPSPGDVTDMWDSILSSGYDELVHIPMSSSLSNSCTTASAMSKEYNGKVVVADNHRISVTLLESVLEARQLADRGASAKEIKDYLERTAYNASIYITVDDLSYLKKGGRITPTVAALGTVLNLKPVLTIQGEKLDAFAKIRGMKKAKQKMIEALKNDLDTRFADISRDQMRIATAGSGVTPEDAENWRKAVADAFPWADVSYQPLSFSLGCHLGPGAYGIGVSVIGDAASYESTTPLQATGHQSCSAAEQRGM